jgi:predicted transcriptional regulator
MALPELAPSMPEETALELLLDALLDDDHPLHEAAVTAFVDWAAIWTTAIDEWATEVMAGTSTMVRVVTPTDG